MNWNCRRWLVCSPVQFYIYLSSLTASCTSTDDETFHLLLCRMAIQSFHFYKSQTTVSSGCLPRLIVTACSLIDYVQALWDRMGFLSMAPVQIGFGVLLASISLLRILKS